MDGIQNIKRVRFIFDALDDFLSLPKPVMPTQMGDVLVSTVTIGLDDTSNLYVCHV